MTETPDQQQKASGSTVPKTGSKRDKWIKLGFAAVFAVAAVLIYLHQRSGPAVPAGWEQDTAYALKVGKEQRRPVVVFIYNDSPSEAARHIFKHALPSSQAIEAIEEFNYIAAIAKVDGLQAEIARRFEIEQLPAIVVVDAQGNMAAKQTGAIGHTELTRLLRAGAGQ
jgi:hypothetical protein